MKGMLNSISFILPPSPLLLPARLPVAARAADLARALAGDALLRAALAVAALARARLSLAAVAGVRAPASGLVLREALPPLPLFCHRPRLLPVLCRFVRDACALAPEGVRRDASRQGLCPRPWPSGSPSFGVELLTSARV